MSELGSTFRPVSRRLRLGMIGGGPGSLVGPVHRIAARLDDQFEFVACALSSDPQRARLGAQALHISADRAYSDWRSMIREEAARQDPVDVVAIVTPNDLHYGPAKACLEAGFHVICDKPLTRTIEEADDLVSTVRATGRVFGVTYTYSGYPMVRRAREIAASGELGRIRIVQVEYVQSWLTELLEKSGHKQASWRTDPVRAGAGGALGDIGSHAFHLAEFVSRAGGGELCADLSSFGEGRMLDDNAHILMRYETGARGMIWVSQVAPGHENDLRLRIYGEKGSLSWSQTRPDVLGLARLGSGAMTLTRGGAGSGSGGDGSTRIPPGHPEGFLEAFANIYSDMAELVNARLANRASEAGSGLVPTAEDGAAGMRFVQAAVDSSRAGGAWTQFG